MNKKRIEVLSGLKWSSETTESSVKYTDNVNIEKEQSLFSVNPLYFKRTEFGSKHPQIFVSLPEGLTEFKQSFNQ